MDYLQRQQLMFSEEEMAKIRQAVVLIAGTGGLGTHQALQLQRIGIKKIYLMDSDRVEISNLNRQILYGKKDLGRFKALRAKEVLDSFHLPTEIVALADSLDENTEVPADVQLLLDALDNLESRFELEKVANRYNLPIVHGGIAAYSGQVSTIIPGKTQGYRAIFGDASAPRQVIPSFAPVVSLTAALQVIEAVKVLLGQALLTDKLLYMDLLDYTFELMQL